VPIEASIRGYNRFHALQGRISQPACRNRRERTGFGLGRGHRLRAVADHLRLSSLPARRQRAALHRWTRTHQMDTRLTVDALTLVVG
jgi:hypothetical protein